MFSGRKALKLSKLAKSKMKQKDASVKHKINDLKVEDSGGYSCVWGDQKTFASLKVTGMDSRSLFSQEISPFAFVVFW